MGRGRRRAYLSEYDKRTVQLKIPKTDVGLTRKRGDLIFDPRAFPKGRRPYTLYLRVVGKKKARKKIVIRYPCKDNTLKIGGNRKKNCNFVRRSKNKKFLCRMGFYIRKKCPKTCG